LELVPQDLVPDAFVLDLEARHEAGKGVNCVVGVYLNHHVWQRSEKHVASMSVDVFFNDLFHPLLPNGKPMQPFMLGLVRVFKEPEGARDEPTSNPIVRHKFQPPSEGSPKQWRRFQIVATPESLRVSVLTGGKFVDFESSPVSRTNLDAYVLDLAKKHISTRLDPSTAPRWGPAGSFGVYVNKAHGSFRNVIITRLPRP
jgi:hypothetical protein